MAGRHYLEHALAMVDVVRDIVTQRDYPGEVEWDPAGPKPAEARESRDAARQAGWDWEWDHRAEGVLTQDVSWTINQATGGLPAPTPYAGGNAEGKVGAAWFKDPVVDDVIDGPELSPQLPSLNRRPGVVQLSACEYVIDRPIYLYPGQTLRGAGVAFDPNGAVSGGTVIYLRGPYARISGIRRTDGPGFRDSCDDPLQPRPVDPDEEVQLIGRALCYETSYGQTTAGAEPRDGEVVPNTTLVVEGIAIVDLRDPPAGEQDPTIGNAALPALDLVGVGLFQVRDCALECRRHGDMARTGLRVYLPSPDTSAYFQHVERCRFRGWSHGIAVGPKSTAFSVEASDFDVPDGGVGISSFAGALRVQHCRFRGDQGGTGFQLTGQRSNHVRGNRFEGLSKAMALADLHNVESGLACASATNRVIPIVGQPRPPQVVIAESESWLPLGNNLAKFGRSKALWHQDASSDEPTTDAGLGGHSLVRNPTLSGFSGREVWDGDRSWPIGSGDEPWFLHATEGRLAETRLVHRPDVTINVGRDGVHGPRGPGMVTGVRFNLTAEPVTPTERLRCHHVWQFLSPPRSASPWPWYVARTVGLAGQPISFSMWIRTNIVRQWSDTNRWGSGVFAGLWHGEETAAQWTAADVGPGLFRGNSGVHSGRGRWEHVSGVGYIPANVRGVGDASISGVRFGVQFNYSRQPTADGQPPYVEISTPSARIGMFTGPTRAPVVTEDGAKLRGRLCPQLGATTTVSLRTGGGEGESDLVVPQESWLHDVYVARSNGMSNAGAITLVDVGGGLVAGRVFGPTVARSGGLDVRMSRLPEGTHLRLVAADARVPTMGSLRMSPVNRPRAY